MLRANRETWRKGLAALVALAAAVVACSGDDDGGGSGLSRDGLAAAGDDCPVDLAGAVADAGLEAGDVTVEEVTEGSGDGGEGDAAIDRVGGVYVECLAPLDGGEDAGVRAVVFASDRPGAVGLLLPLLSQDLDVTTGGLEDVYATVEDTDEGELADLGVEGPGAVARLDIDGAESGVLYVSSPSGASPAEVRATAEALLDGL